MLRRLHLCRSIRNRPASRDTDSIEVPGEETLGRSSVVPSHMRWRVE